MALSLVLPPRNTDNRAGVGREGRPALAQIVPGEGSMARLLASDKGAREVVVRTERGATRYKTRNGVYEVENPKHAAQMKAEGFFEASLSGTVAGTAGRGYTCQKCGFGSWFRKCSRCGEVN